MMKFRFGLGLLGLVYASASPAATVLVYGDSISAAYGLEVRSGWVAKLQQKLEREPGGPHRVVNASVSGETTSGGLSRLPKILAQARPDVLVLELGGNDGLRGQPPALMAQNLQAMIRAARAQKVKVLLLGMKIPPNYGQGYTRAFEAVYTQVAGREQVPLVPFFLDGVGGDEAYMQADGIHPNGRAQDRLLANVWPKLRPLL